MHVKVAEHILLDFSIFATSTFKNVVNKYDVCKDEDFMKKFCKITRKGKYLLHLWRKLGVIGIR